tara:strand:- start:642 stop:857 length:216 start_codon:yes stop_codon:yes gene_type:complete
MEIEQTYQQISTATVNYSKSLIMSDAETNPQTKMLYSTMTTIYASTLTGLNNRIDILMNEELTRRLKRFLA